jgi:hypothetical protein
MDRLHEVENLRRSIAMLSPGTTTALGREDAMKLLEELGEVQSRLEGLKRDVRRLADEA